jgi:hypothetical protein
MTQREAESGGRIHQVDAFLRTVAAGIEQYDPQWLDGVVQFSITAPVEAHWYFAPPTVDEPHRVAVTRGQHPSPTWSLACSLDTLLDIAAGRFSFRDPRSLSSLSIGGDALALRERLSPFFSPPALAKKLGRYRLLEEAAARIASEAGSLEVHRIRELSVDALEWAAERLIPVVFERGLHDWPVWRWTLPTLIDKTRGIPHFDYVRLEQGRLGDFVERIAGRGALPGAARNLAAGGLAFPTDLCDELRTAELAPLHSPTQLLWFGAADALTPLHRDNADVLNLQVIGRKRWTLFSPDQADRLYPQPPIEGFQPSRVDLSRPDLQRFPRYTGSRPIEVTLRPGEVMFNPAGWFHEVRALDPAVSVSLPLLYPTRIPRATI